MFFVQFHCLSTHLCAKNRYSRRLEMIILGRCNTFEDARDFHLGSCWRCAYVSFAPLTLDNVTHVQDSSFVTMSSPYNKLEELQQNSATIIHDHGDLLSTCLKAFR